MRTAYVVVSVMILAAFCGRAAASEDVAAKQRVAVGELVWAVPGNSWGVIANPDNAKEVMSGLRTMISTTLIQTRKFEMVERADLGQLVEELKLTHESGLVDLDDLRGVPEWGRLSGIDWLVLGTVTHFAKDNSSRSVGGIGGMATQSFFLVVDVRLIEVATGIMRDATPVEIKVNVGTSVVSSKVDHGTFSNQKGAAEQLSNLMRTASRELVRHIAAGIVPIKVIGITSDEVVLNYGEGVLQQDDYLVIFRKGEVFVDPDTGEGEAELIVDGRLRVYQTQRAISKAVPIEKTNVQNVEVGTICKFGMAPRKKQTKLGTLFRRKKRNL